MCRTIDEDDFGNHRDKLWEADEMEKRKIVTVAYLMNRLAP